MNSCQGKIYDYSNKQNKFGFLDIYNLLNYKFYNDNKTTIKNTDYTLFLKENSILNNQLEKIMKKQKMKSPKQLINKLENILEKRIILLESLKKQINLYSSLKISFSNLKKLEKELKQIKEYNKYELDIFTDSLLNGDLILDNKYTLYDNFSKFFNITNEFSKQIISENNNIIKNIILNKNPLFDDINKEINNELENNLNTQRFIKQMNLFFYISPYTNKIDSNKLNIEIDTIKNHSTKSNTIITKESYPIIKPICIYNENNEPIKFINVYSPKEWKINNTTSNVINAYNEALIYIKINYLFNVKTNSDFKKVEKILKQINCNWINTGKKYNICAKKLHIKKIKKHEIETKSKFINSFIKNILTNNSNILGNDFLFNKLIKKKDEDLSHYFIQKNLLESKHYVLSETEKYLMQTLLNLSNIDKESNKIIKNYSKNFNNTQLNDMLVDLIKIKFEKSIKKTFKINNYSKDLSKMKQNSKIIYDFSQRSKYMERNFKKNIKKISKYQEELYKQSTNNNIFSKINESNQIENNMKQIQLELLNDGNKIIKLLRRDLQFVIKINNFIKTFIDDLFFMKKNYNTNLMEFKKTIKKILVKIPKNLELSKGTLDIIDGEDLELDNFYPENFFMLLSYMTYQNDNFINNIYNLFIKINNMKENLNPAFDCFVDIQTIINKNYKENIDNKSDIWMWENTWGDNNKWEIKNNKIINNQKQLLITYPFVFTKTSQLSSRNNISPCILKWLTEDDKIFVEMAKNFLSAKDEESLDFLLKTLNQKTIKSFYITNDKFSSISEFFSKLGVFSNYNKNLTITKKYKCFIPNKIKIDNLSSIDSKIFKLNEDIKYFKKQILINSLIQINLLDNIKELTNDIETSGSKVEERKLQKNTKIANTILMEKLYQFIGFLYKVHTKKNMTERGQKNENIQKNKIKEERKFEEKETDIDQNYEGIITDIDDIF